MVFDRVLCWVCCPTTGYRLQETAPQLHAVIVGVLSHEALATAVNDQRLRAHCREVHQVVAHEARRHYLLCYSEPIRPLHCRPVLWLIVKHHGVQVLRVVLHELAQFSSVLAAAAAKLELLSLVLLAQVQLEKVIPASNYFHPGVDVAVRHAVCLLSFHENGWPQMDVWSL